MGDRGPRRKSGDVSPVSITDVDEIHARLYHFARRVAQRLPPSLRIDFVDDMVVEGWIAAHAAAGRYDAEKTNGAMWWTYVGRRAKGAMLDYLRFQRRELGFTRGTDHKVVRHALVVSLEETIETLNPDNPAHVDLKVDDALSPEEQTIYRDMERCARTDRERFILRQQLEGYTNRETAKALGVSPCRVSQLKAVLFDRIRFVFQ